MLFWPQPPEHWNYRSAPPRPARFHLYVLPAHNNSGPLNSADSSILNPALQKSTTSETSPAEPPDPLAPPPAPSAEPLGFSSADPHLYHQIRLLLKQMQDVKVLLGHLVMELRDLTVYLKPGVTNAADK